VSASTPHLIRPEHPAHGGVMLRTVQCRPASACAGKCPPRGCTLKKQDKTRQEIIHRRPDDDLPTPPKLQSPTGPTGGSKEGGGAETHGTGLIDRPKSDRRAKLQSPPVRPLRRLGIGTQHTSVYLETHPSAWLWLVGQRQGRACGGMPRTRKRKRNNTFLQHPLYHRLLGPSSPLQYWSASWLLANTRPLLMTKRR